MNELIAKACSLDPNVGDLNEGESILFAPWHDSQYTLMCQARKLIGEEDYESILLVPFGKVGGADLVAGILSNAVTKIGRTLILRTDAPDWDRPDWYPSDVDSVDISTILSNAPSSTRMLYALLMEIGAKRIYNVNSRLGFDTFARYGSQLSSCTNLYSYYFCADRTPTGVDAGYPIWYFANILPHLKAAFMDTEFLAKVLSERYTLPKEMREKVVTVYTPALREISERPIVEDQIGSSTSRKRSRIVWAGRLDRQKRFDLLVSIAKAMPDIDFVSWGKAVLDSPPNLSGIPSNLVMKGPFKDYDELNLVDSDGWLYTAAWDGLPTILIELGAMGVPIVASAVGGVPELIDHETGWLVEDCDNVDAYVAALRDMLASPERRLAKVESLQMRIRDRHSVGSYEKSIRAH
jgi:glycosyltransferase involved in cell wall biosynthesis